MKRLLAVWSAALLIACAHGKTPEFPAGALVPADAAEVYVIRNNELFGFGLSVGVNLNDATIAHLRAGEHIRFLVPPGLHRIGIRTSGAGVALDRGRTYYFLISVDDSPAGFEIERLDRRRGEEWVAKTRRLP
ncbi:MAG: DUF2846 domain-containing protein [Desulfobacterales bacterium]|nr:DUF2846 domain-containing protein [Desulfobacterales bacterium]